MREKKSNGEYYMVLRAIQVAIIVVYGYKELLAKYE